MYASFGIAALLKDEGISAQIIGGDFVCAVIAKDQSQMTLQGFGSQPSKVPSHYWIEAQGTLIDLGTMYLPYGSSFPASPLPVMRWPTTLNLPDFVAYREAERFSKEVEIADPVLRTRNSEFVSVCRKSRSTHTGIISLNTWELTSLTALHQAAVKGDSWARAVTIFLRRSLRAEFPS
jgi:hypothetical protein